MYVYVVMPSVGSDDLSQGKEGGGGYLEQLQLGLRHQSTVKETDCHGSSCHLSFDQVYPGNPKDSHPTPVPRTYSTSQDFRTHRFNVCVR